MMMNPHESQRAPGGLGPQQARVYLTIRGMIDSGHLQPGQQLPNQAELAARHGVALATMNQALRALEQDGYIVRRQGVGTFVADSLPQIEGPLRALSRLSARSFASSDEAIAAILALIAEQTDMRSAFLSRFEGDQLRIVADHDHGGCGIRAGTLLQLEDAF
jgi:DNA-binding GntR family transcriptional regulator